MHKFKIQEKGIILISILMLSVLLIMMTTSMIIITTESLNLTGTADQKTRAMVAAEAGIEFARYQLNHDPNSWGISPPVDFIVNLGNNQEFAITFNNAKPYHSTNNLDGDTYIGTTPPFTAEIICKGVVKLDGVEKEKVYLRALFSRDDDYPCPVSSDGYLFINADGSPPPVYTLQGDPINPSPVRIHSNNKITISGDSAASCIVDLTGGYASSCTTVDVIDVNNPVIEKEGALSVQIANIDIGEMISYRPYDPNDPNTCLDLPNNTFYLVGHFEYDPPNPDDPNDPKYDPGNPIYDPNSPLYDPSALYVPYNPYDDPYDPSDDPNGTYCIPHSSPVSIPPDALDPNNPDPYIDPNVYTTDYTVGIVSFSENSCKDFLDNYGDFYYNPTVGAPGGENRDFCDYYDIKFWKYDPDPNSRFQEIEDEMGMDISVTGNPASMVYILLTLQRDLYVNSTNGFFETDWIGKVDGSSEYYPDSMYKTIVELDMNGHTIYGSKLWLGISPRGSGGIISSETIDFILSGNITEMISLSEESVRISYREPARQNGSTLIYRGIIYAKDDILIQANSPERRDKRLEIYGAMTSKNRVNGNLTASPFVYYKPAFTTRNISIFTEGKTLDDIFIVHTDDGLETLAALRQYPNAVRMTSCEVMNY